MSSCVDVSNTASFRNRYLNSGYRGTADLGPVRFNATRAQTARDLSLINSVRPTTATQQQYQQQVQATQPFRPASAAVSSSAPLSDSPSQQRFAASRSNFADHQAQQQARLIRDTPQQYAPGQAYEATPRGVYTAPSQGASAGQQQQRYQDAGVSVNENPYYVPPYAAPPSQKFAPNATALGNRTYAFETAHPDYAHSSTFRGRPRESSRQLQDPAQSIPFGRLEAEDARDVRLKMSLDSWDTFNAYDRGVGAVNYNLSGLKSKTLDADNYCKTSISRRLESGAQLRYQVPGYMGYIPSAQFRHGSTYGKTTRQCLSGSQVGL